MSRYKVPNKTNVSVELSQRDIPSGFNHHGPAKKEAEKPEYDNALCNNVLKFWQPRQEEHEAPEKSVPYYHVLEVTEKDAPPEEQGDEACVPLQENVHCYQVLEDLPVIYMDPYDIQEESAMGPKDNTKKEPLDEPYSTSAYYHVLEEGSLSEAQMDCGYKELQSNGCFYAGYQPLQKYT